MLLALKNSMNVCPGPQELYYSKHMDMNPTKRVCSILYTLATTEQQARISYSMIYIRSIYMHDCMWELINLNNQNTNIVRVG